MQKFNDSIESRTTSGYPISIATSLALETLYEPRLEPYDPERPIPPKPNLNNYDSIYINVNTLIRNMANSMDKMTFIMTSVDKIENAILLEMDVINSIFSVEGKGLIKPIFYLRDYSSFYKEAIKKQITIRKPKTEYQKSMEAIQQFIFNRFKHNEDIKVYTNNINPSKFKKSLILTHIPLDLLSYKSFSVLDLLESNTGKVKTKFEWNTKYMKVGERSVNILPFNRKLLYLFGDKVLIRPGPIKIRRLILDIAESNNWTPATTEDKVNLDLKLKLLDPVANTYIQSL